MSVKHTIDKFVRVDRYYISGLHPHIWKHPEGEMVYFDDYVHLWAEKERLKAEVERLRKAGDDLYESKIGYYGEQILEDMKHHSGELCRNWNAAKEGKPSV